MLFGILVAVAVVAGVVAGYIFSNGFVKEDPGLKSSSIHRFKVAGLDGNVIDFSDFRGKRIMVVNTASRCGLTPQYAALERLYKEYGDRLVIIGFPSNDFLFQEPGGAEEIAGFCQKNYGVSFPMAAKIEVKGAKQAPVYQWLTRKSLNGVESSAVTWNFQKYILDDEGRLLGHFSPKTPPDAPEILAIIRAGI